MTPELLEEFGEAWNQREVDRIMSYFTDDCVYQASVGPEPGQTYIGKEAVRAGIVEMLAHDSGGVSVGGPCFVAGNRGVAEWSYEFMDDTGMTTVVRGCDIFEFDGNRIHRKDAFRKTYPS